MNRVFLGTGLRAAAGRAAGALGLRPRSLVRGSAWGVCGLVLLALGVWLGLVFGEERAEALGELRARQAALAEVARRSFGEALDQRLLHAALEIEAASQDPLRSDADLLWVRSGATVLPRSRNFAAAGDGSVRALHLALFEALEKSGGERAALLQQQVAEPDSPFGQAIAHLARFAEELEQNPQDPTQVEAHFRALLSQRARFVLPVVRALPLTLTTLEFFSARGRPSDVLMAGLLRDGLGGRPGAQLRGLQPALLEHRGRFGPADFAYLAERIAKLSEHAGVRHDDFLERAHETEPARPRFEAVSQPTLAGDWYLVPELAAGDVVDRPPTELRGLRLDRALMLREVAESMRALDLLEAEDVLAFALSGVSAIPRASLAFELSSPRWQRARARIESRYWIKTALLAASGLLLCGTVALALAGERRRQRYLDLKSEFVATVSHELRSPLASIRLQAESLEMRLAGDPRAGAYPARMLRDVDRLSFLVDNILSFNRLDKEAWKPLESEISLGELTSELRKELPLHTEAPVEIYCSEPARLLRVDPDLARLLFLNLGRNACLYNEREPVSIAIRTEGRAILFRDNGVGIARDHWSTVFEAFQRVPGRQGVSGSGLGLAICRRVMEAHRGTIHIAHSDASGTTFSLEFP